MSGFEALIPVVLSVAGGVAGGISARRAGEYESQQADVAAGQAQAASQRAAQEQLRRGRFAASRAQAVAAASGAGASDPTVMDIIGDITAEGAYRSRLALYEGDDRARAYKERGKTAEFAGRSRQRAGYLQAAGAVAGGYLKNRTLLDKYGGMSGGSGIGTDQEDFGGAYNPYDRYGAGP